MKRAFTLVELMIVVAILGILAALAIPVLQDHIIQTKESAAKQTLKIMREGILRYAAEHGGIAPGYMDDDPSQGAGFTVFFAQFLRDGKYISDFAINPFNKLKFINIIQNNTSMPGEADGTSGWIYKPETRQFRLNWQGTDADGVRYYDY